MELINFLATLCPFKTEPLESRSVNTSILKIKLLKTKTFFIKVLYEGQKNNNSYRVSELYKNYKKRANRYGRTDQLIVKLRFK